MIIAISGGIGSGKSQVSARLKQLGYNVIDADEINKELLGEKYYLDKLYAAFPQCFDDEILVKQKLKELIFNNENERKKLNAIAHPEIVKRLVNKAEEMGGTVFAEIPLLIESGLGEANFRQVWAVVADKDKRIQRIVARDKISVALAEKMIGAQEAEASAVNQADFVIDNNAGLDALYANIDEAIKGLNAGR